jgi:hypothetical protein
LERLEEALIQKADISQVREKADVSMVNRVSSAVQKLQQTASQKEKLLQELTQSMPLSVQRMRDVLGKTLVSVKDLREAVQAEQQKTTELEAAQGGMEDRWRGELRDFGCKIVCQNHDMEHHREELHRGLKQVTADHHTVETVQQALTLKASGQALNDLSGRLQALEITIETKPNRQDLAELVVHIMNQNSLKARRSSRVFS